MICNCSFSKEIFWIDQNTNLFQREIAKLYNVTRSCISCILFGSSWKHLNRKDTINPINIKEVNQWF